MSDYVQTWHGVARQGWARLGKARLGMARQGKEFINKKQTTVHHLKRWETKK